MNNIFFVFDVESIGLHGEGFMVGYVVVRRDGEVLAEGVLGCDPSNAKGAQSDRDWVSENIPKRCTANIKPSRIRSGFWEAWMEWKSQGAIMAADCVWPVEARFLAACVDDAPEARRWHGPYPLLDISTLTALREVDPLTDGDPKHDDRLPNELPVHDPLCDARQSARLLLESLNRLGC